MGGNGKTLSAPVILSRKELHRGRTIALQELQVQMPLGQVSTYHNVTHPGAVVILPLTENGRIVLLRQFRVALNDFIFEFPAGTLDPKEDPLVCAKRELLEETGYVASDWHALGFSYPAPGFCDEKQYLFVAKGLELKESAHEEDEIICVGDYSAQEISEMVVSGEICDGKSLALLYKAQAARLFSISCA